VHYIAGALNYNRIVCSSDPELTNVRARILKEWREKDDKRGYIWRGKKEEMGMETKKEYDEKKLEGGGGAEKQEGKKKT